MNVRCPQCAKTAPLSEYGKGFKRKDHPKWYEASDEYTEKVCPSCGSTLRLTTKSKAIISLVIVSGVALGALVWFWQFAWLLLGLWVVAVFFVRGTIEFELND